MVSISPEAKKAYKDAIDSLAWIRIDESSNLLRLKIDCERMTISYLGPNVGLDGHDRAVRNFCDQIKHYEIEIICLIQNLEKLGYTTAPRSCDDEVRIQKELVEALNRLD